MQVSTPKECQCKPYIPIFRGGSWGRIFTKDYKIERCTYCLSQDKLIEELRRQNERLQSWKQLLEAAPGETHEILRERCLSADYMQPIIQTWRDEVAKKDRVISDLQRQLEKAKAGSCSTALPENMVRSDNAPSSPDDRIEFRTDADGLDEVVIRDAEMVHFERMSDQSIWCGVYVGDKRVCLWIGSKNGKSHVNYTATTEPYASIHHAKSPIEETAITRDNLLPQGGETSSSCSKCLELQEKLQIAIHALERVRDSTGFATYVPAEQFRYARLIATHALTTLKEGQS